MVDGGDIAGMGADLIISFAVGKATGGLGPVKQGLADAVGGFAGGYVADAFSNGWSPASNVQAGMWGAGGSLLGSVLGQGASWGLKKRGPRADNALSEAQNVHSTAADQARRLEQAQDGVTGADETLRQARRALDNANDRAHDAETRLNQLRPSDRGYDTALTEFNAATAAKRAAQSTFDDADNAAQAARRTLGDAQAAHPGLQTAADNAEAAMKAAERRAKMWGKKGTAVKWVKPPLVMTGSGAFVAGKVISWGSDGSSAEPVPLVWDGRAAAAAASLAGQAPFVESEVGPGVTVVGGQGFLLRPEDSLLSPQVISAVGGATGSLAASVVDIYQMSGDLEKKIELRLDPAPRMPQGITVGSSSGGDSYNQATVDVESALDDLYESEVSNKARAEKIEEISATVKENVGFLIAGANTEVQQLTASSELEVKFMDIVSQGFEELIGILETAASAMERVASGIEDPGAGDKEGSQELKDRLRALENSMNDPGLQPDGSNIGLTDPAGLDGLGVGNPEFPGTASADLADAAKQMEERANDALQANSDPGSLGGMTDPAAAANMAGGNPMDAWSRMMMMSQLMGRNGADSDLARRVDDIDPARYDAAAPPNMPVARPAATTPWSTQPAAPQTPAQPVNHQSAPPIGATSNQTGSGMPKRVPGADGLVVYPFPDGRTQKVTLTRALGLDNGFANKSGTDAQAAYAKTPAEWTNHKDIGAAVDPFRLSTGDVAMWRRAAKEGEKVPAGADAVIGTAIAGPANDDENSPVSGPEKPEGRQSGDSGGEPEYRTAVLVVFGDGESGTVEAIVQGELQPFEPEMADADGAMGEFAGFKRPNGLEDSGADGQDTDTAMNTDQPAMDMPALAGPA